MQIAEMILGSAAQKPAPMVRPPMPPIVEKAKRLLVWIKKLATPVTGEQKNALAVTGKISLGPKKTLVMVEARGQSFLIAMSGDSTPAFMPLSEALPEERPAARKRQSVRKGNPSC